MRRCLDDAGLGDAPVYFVSSNTHSLVNLLTGTARELEDEVVAHVEREGPEDLREELHRFQDGRTEGSWENFLYYGARGLFAGPPEDGPRGGAAWRASARPASALGSRTALRVSAQIMDLSRLDPAGLDPRLGDVDPAGWPPPTR